MESRLGSPGGPPSPGAASAGRPYPRPVRRIVAVTGSIVFLDAMLFGAIIPLLPGSPTTTT